MQKQYSFWLEYGVALIKTKSYQVFDKIPFIKLIQEDTFSITKEVDLLQRQLRQLKYYEGYLIDVVFGEFTKEAVKLFQEKNGLYPANGLVRKKTRFAI